MKFADLHMHTNASDGRLTPDETIDLAVRDGRLSVIAITDHNRLDSARRAKAHAQRKGYPIRVIVGTEISSKDGHIVGLGVRRKITPGRSAEWTVQKIHEQEGLAVAVHPTFGFSRSLSVESLERLMNGASSKVFLDGIEVFNAGVEPFGITREDGSNSRARSFYLDKGRGEMAPLGNTDGHFYTVGRGLTGFEGELEEAISKGSTAVLGTDLNEGQRLLQVAEEMFGDRVQEARMRYERLRQKHPEIFQEV